MITAIRMLPVSRVAPDSDIAKADPQALVPVTSQVDVPDAQLPTAEARRADQKSHAESARRTRDAGNSKDFGRSTDGAFAQPGSPQPGLSASQSPLPQHSLDGGLGTAGTSANRATATRFDSRPSTHLQSSRPGPAVTAPDALRQASPDAQRGANVAARWAANATALRG